MLRLLITSPHSAAMYPAMKLSIGYEAHLLGIQASTLKRSADNGVQNCAVCYGASHFHTIQGLEK